MLVKHLRYLRYVLRHKWWVLYWGLRLDVPLWQLIVHDLSKFGPDEWEAYAEWFYGSHESGMSWPEVGKLVKRVGRADIIPQTGVMYAYVKGSFDKAWRHHWQNNLHHWERYAYTWCSIPEHGVHELANPVPMPDRFKREMLADWLATGMGLKGHGVKEAPAETLAYFLENRHRQRIHPDVAYFLEWKLADMIRMSGG